MDVWRRILVSLCLLIGAFPLLAADRPQIICYGDSITAGHGLNPEQAYPAVLQRDLDQHGYSYKVTNMGTSGATTKDAVADVGAVIKAHPAVVIVEFGGNDGLRGLPLDQTRKNLDAVLTALDGAHIKVLLAGITLPPNYGPDYIGAFDKVFRDMAAKHHTAFCSDDLQGPGERAGNDPGRRNPPDRQRVRNYCRYAHACAETTSV